MERIDTRDMQAALFMSFSPQITTSSVNLFMTPAKRGHDHTTDGRRLQDEEFGTGDYILEP